MNEIKGRIVLEDKTSSTIDKIINRVNKLGTAGAKVSNNLQKMFNGNFKIQEVSKQIDDVISKLEKQSASGFELNELGAKRYAEQLYKLTNQLNQLQGAGSSSLSDIDAQTQKVKEDTRSYRKEIEKVKAQFNGMVSNGFGDSFKNIFESIDNSSIKELEYLIKQLYGREISIDMSKPREEINKTIKELLNFSALLGSLGNPEKYNSLIENQFKKLGTEVNKATAAMEKFGNAAKSAEDKTGKALEKINKSIGKFFKTYVIMRLISTTMSAFGKYFSEAHKALLDMDAASGGLIGYNIQLSAINSALQRLAAQIVVCGANFLNAFGPAIVFVINLVNKLIEGINMLFAALGGKNSYLVAKDNYFKDYAAGLKDTDENAQGANGSLKKLYTLISGFDELNTLSAQNGVADSIKSAAGGLSNIKWDDLFEEKPLQGFWKWLSEVVQKIKEFLAQVPSWVKWLGAVAAAIAALITWFKLKNKTLNIQNGLEHLATKGLELMWLVVGTGIALLPGLISKLKDLVKGLKDTGKATDDNLGEENQGAWNNWG